jgi:hypothetical protein
MTTVAAPMVFQCGACYRVVSDSNQLLAAVEELGVLVLDAVVGVRVGEADDADEALPLHCSACEHLLGRMYRRAPAPDLDRLVHTRDAPRFSLAQSALASYVLGSAAAASAAAATNGDSDAHGGGSEAQIGSAAGGELSAPREGADEGTQQQLTQLMRVVLALDQRLRSLEAVAPPDTGAADGDDDANGSGRKRAR